MIKKVIQNEDFELTFVTRMWGGEQRVDFPVMRWPNGQICEPTTHYFGYCAAERYGVGMSSLRPEAYALREWFAFLMNSCVHYLDVENLHLSMFRDSHSARIASEEIHPYQVERKLGTICTFYRLLDIALPYDDYGRKRRKMVSTDIADRSCPITTVEVETKSGRRIWVWTGANGAKPKNTKRPTPNDIAVALILAWIRSRPERLAQKYPGKVVSKATHFASERDWLIARGESEAGLRAEEAVVCSMANIWEMLTSEGAQLGNSYFDLTWADGPTKEKLMAFLNQFETERKYMYLRITGKGGKTRYAPIKVGLVRDLLSIGIWVGRKFILELWSNRPEFIDDDSSVFLSTKTGKRLDPGSAGDIVKEAFIGTGIPGSGQRLRAHYGTMLAASLWEDTMVKNGFVYSQALYNLVLHQLAEAMGHEDVETTLRNYLDMAIMRYFGFSSRKKFLAFMKVWNSIAEQYTALDSLDIETIIRVAKALARAKGPMLREVIQLLLQRPDLNPDPEPIEPSPPPPKARLVHSQ